MFSPNEALSNPLALHLVFCQVVQDVLSLSCIRISREERNKMRKLLDSYGITLSNLHSPHHKVTIKKNIIDMAKDWPTYFARIFPITVRLEPFWFKLYYNFNLVRRGVTRIRTPSIWRCPTRASG